MSKARAVGGASCRIATAILHAGKTREAFDAEWTRSWRQAEWWCWPVHAHPVRWFVRGWEGRLINIHPSLLPAYKGIRVHERVIEAGEKLSGASVHFVVPELDAGPVIAQASMPVAPGDTPQTLANRVLAVEHKLYPEALKLLAADKVKLQNGLAVFS